jgi:hypothetical protein
MYARVTDHLNVTMQYYRTPLPYVMLSEANDAACDQVISVASVKLKWESDWLSAPSAQVKNRRVSVPSFLSSSWRVPM